MSMRIWQRNRKNLAAAQRKGGSFLYIAEAINADIGEGDSFSTFPVLKEREEKWRGERGGSERPLLSASDSSLSIFF